MPSFLLYLAQARTAAVLESKPPKMNSDWQCTPYCGVSGVRTKLLVASRNTDASACHPHAQPCRTFCCKKNPKQTAIQDCLGGSICCRWLHMFCPKHHLLFFCFVLFPPRVIHQRELCSIFHTSAVAEVLALSAAHFCVMYKLLHHTAVTQLSLGSPGWSFKTISGRSISSYFVYIKKKAIRKDRKQQFINIIQICEILLPLSSCSNVWAT